MTVGAFVGLAASSQPPGERRVSECREGCLRPLAALSFLEPRAGYRVCDLAASFPTRKRLMSVEYWEGCPSVPGSPLSLSEQLASSGVD